MDLFEAGSARMKQEEPLAARMRPLTLDEFAGQQEIVGPGRLLRRAIQADQLSSLIFYGPPGTGKTTLARVIANTTSSSFITINAVLSGVKDIRAAVEKAQESRNLYGSKTILFVDEVHRWNKAQQDALLPWVENGTIILIGATTENPYFEVNRALVSRSRIFQLKPLANEDLYNIARRTLSDKERGYGGMDIRIDKQALDHLVDVANGDARTLLNALELAVETTPERPLHITMEIAEESIQRRAVLYDKEGDYHFDTISAFIKSLRGSDPDAALYWMARMLYAGENPRFMFRRMLILASEDVGLADPNALVVVEAAAAAFERVGLPEGRFFLTQAALYLATAAKSNSTLAFFDAIKTVESEQDTGVPNHLKDASRDKEGFGHGQGYLYPHAYRDHWVAQQYLPTSLQGRLFYQPGSRGYEAHIKIDVERRRDAQLAAMADASRPAEVLTFSYPDHGRDLWLERLVSKTADHLEDLREKVFASLDLPRHGVVLDLRAGSGLLLWEALRRAPEGGALAVAWTQGQAAELKARAEQLKEVERPVIVHRGGRQDLLYLARVIGEENGTDLRFEGVVGRNALNPFSFEQRVKILVGVKEMLAATGMVSLVEVVPSQSTRPSSFLDLSSLGGELSSRLQEREEFIYNNPDDPRVNWGRRELLDAFRQAGLEVKSNSPEKVEIKRLISAADIEGWFAAAEAGRPAGYGSFLAAVFSREELKRIKRLFEEQLSGRTVTWLRVNLYVTAEKRKDPEGPVSS